MTLDEILAAFKDGVLEYKYRGTVLMQWRAWVGDEPPHAENVHFYQFRRAPRATEEPGRNAGPAWPTEPLPHPATLTEPVRRMPPDEVTAALAEGVPVHEVAAPSIPGAASVLGTGNVFLNVHPTAPELLAVAAQHMEDRAKTYDQPGGERNMAHIVEAFNAVTGRDLSESEGWLFMELLKAVRDYRTPGGHADSQEDRIAYAALGAEARRAGR